ncbi:trypsin-like serine peptidase [Streptomyces sp. NPDC013157]|uniref:trypsin-like serine peptidase n=1 Tax=Streptomyces sp. NPDC013157 TaxID=3364861 RepID=UPI0036A2AB5C
MATVDTSATDAALGGTPHDLRQQHAMAAAQRYRQSAGARERAQAQTAQGVPYPDTVQALAARAERILTRSGIPPAAAVAGVRADPLELPQVHERIIGLSNELQAVSFLPRGTRAAATVARISLRSNGRELPLGTGFLVSPRLLLTNHHVLPDTDSARSCFVEFNAQVTADNVPDTAVRTEFDPGTLFVAHEPLDFALVAVAPVDGKALPGDVFGWNRLSVQTGKLVVGELVNIVGHPNGRLKEIALRDNKLLVRLDDFLQYQTDTEPGNSGSPVFNDQWEVVALHHSGVPETDPQGHVLRKDGKVWQPSDGDDAVSWVANEGVRISSVLRHLAALRPAPAEHALLSDMGPESGLGSQLAPDGMPIAPDGSLWSGPLPLRTSAEAATPTTGPTAPTAALAAVRPRAGLRGRPGAFGGHRNMVFLHGRGQQGKDPEALRREWAAGLNNGLTRAGRATVEPADIWFPYYGDRLAERTGGETAVAAAAALLDGASAPSAAEAVGRLTAESTRDSDAYGQLLREAAVKVGMQEEADPTEGVPAASEGLDQLVGTFHRALTWLAASTDVDEWTIATVFGDVSRYLSVPGVRDAVLDTVLGTMPDHDELILVTHSLGTVVGMDLLDRLSNGIDRVLLVTLGSPLGMDAVNSRLLTGAPHPPPGVDRWVNAWCPTDAVAIGCPLGDPRWGELSQPGVTNAQGRAHNVTEYLAHATVAGPIGQALS